MKIRLITDSASDLTQATRPDMTILPLTVTFGQTEYLDGVTLSHQEFYEKLVECGELPTTSQVSPYAFEQAFQKAKEAGETALVITLSEALSGTYQSALAAARKYPGVAFVVDSRSVCVGEKILVEYALRLMDAGMSVEIIAATLEQAREKICVIALLDTLEYLRRGGRISKTVGLLGEALSIKPVITLDQGKVRMLGKARGSKNGNNLLNHLIRQSQGIDFSMPIALGYSGLNDALLQKYIRDSEEIWKPHTDSLPCGTIGGTIGTHAGPGAVAVAFFHP